MIRWRLVDAATGEILIGGLTFEAARRWYDTFTSQGLEVVIGHDPYAGERGTVLPNRPHG